MSEVLSQISGMATLDYSVWVMPHKLPTSEVIALVETAMNVAEVDGFINPLVLGTMLWLHLAAVIMPDVVEELNKEAETNGIFDAFDKMLEKGLLDKLIADEHVMDVEYTFAMANMWYDSYSKYSPTFAGQIGKMSFLTEDSVKDTLQGIQKVLADGNVEQITKIAEAWGMNNELPESVPAEQ